MSEIRLVNGPSACALLGVGGRALESLVETGRLTAHVRPGGVRRMYDAAEIAALNAAFAAIEGEQETTREQIVRGWTIQYRKEQTEALAQANNEAWAKAQAEAVVEESVTVEDIMPPTPMPVDPPVIPNGVDVMAEINQKLDALAISIRDLQTIVVRGLYHGVDVGNPQV